MILGMNVLEFVLVAWTLSVAAAWSWDFGPEIYQEQMAAWREKHPKDAEITVELPVASFDPDETMKLPKARKEFNLDVVFVINRQPKKKAPRRHARV